MRETIIIWIFNIIAIMPLIIISVKDLLCKILSTIQTILFLLKIIFGINLIPIVLILTPSRPTKKTF